jgi:LysR substrate binding domain
MDEHASGWTLLAGVMHRIDPDRDGYARCGRLVGLMFRSGYDLRDVTLEACRRAGFEPTYAVEGGEMDAVLAFVEAGLGVAVVPSMVLVNRPLLRATPAGAAGDAAHHRTGPPQAFRASARRRGAAVHAARAYRHRRRPAGRGRRPVRLASRLCASSAPHSGPLSDVL